MLGAHRARRVEMGAPDRIHASGRPYSNAHWPLPHAGVCITEHMVKGDGGSEPGHPCGAQRAGKQACCGQPPAAVGQEAGLFSRPVLRAGGQSV